MDVSNSLCFLTLQGRPGEKGQKGDVGVSSGVDVFSSKVKKIELSLKTRDSNNKPKAILFVDPTFHFVSSVARRVFSSAAVLLFLLSS